MKQRKKRGRNFQTRKGSFESGFVIRFEMDLARDSEALLVGTIIDGD